MAAKFVYAKDQGGKIVHVSKVPNGRACNCRCVECNEYLDAVHPKEISHYFRHITNTNCTGGPETALHLLSKQIIAADNKINLPEKGYFEYESSWQEKELRDIRPDIQLAREDSLLCVEITVSHFDKFKESKFREYNISAIEIDLQKVDRAILEEDLRKILIQKLDLKKILHWEREVNDGQKALLQKESGSLTELILTIGPLIAIPAIILYKLFKGNR